MNTYTLYILKDGGREYMTTSLIEMTAFSMSLNLLGMAKEDKEPAVFQVPTITRVV